MEHGEIVKAIEVEIEKATKARKDKIINARMLVECAGIPAEDYNRAVKIANGVLKRMFGGYSEEELEQQLQWRDEQILRHAETLPEDERDAYLQSEVKKYEQEAERALAEADTLLKLARMMKLAQRHHHTGNTQL
jgi:hypothetical protein